MDSSSSKPADDVSVDRSSNAGAGSNVPVRKLIATLLAISFGTILECESVDWGSSMARLASTHCFLHLMHTLYLCLLMLCRV